MAEDGEEKEAMLTFPLTGVKETFRLTKHALCGMLPPWEYDPVDDLIRTLVVLFDEHKLTMAGSPLEALLDLRMGNQVLTPAMVVSMAAKCSHWMAQHILLRDIVQKVPSGQLLDLIADQCYIRVEHQLELFSTKRFGTPSSRNAPELTYGELNSPLVRELILDRYCQAESLFVDFGSGIGNAVLLAATRCARAVGVECQPKLHHFAEIYKGSMVERLASVGFYECSKRLKSNAHFIFGDFTSLETPPLALLRNADLILVNNLAFPPELNHKVVLRFLDLKAGALVISLVPFLYAHRSVNQSNTIDMACTATNAGPCPIDAKKSFKGKEIRHWHS